MKQQHLQKIHDYDGQCCTNADDDEEDLFVFIV
jgi:hypothetical protein